MHPPRGQDNQQRPEILAVAKLWEAPRLGALPEISKHDCRHVLFVGHASRSGAELLRASRTRRWKWRCQSRSAASALPAFSPAIHSVTEASAERGGGFSPTASYEAIIHSNPPSNDLPGGCPRGVTCPSERSRSAGEDPGISAGILPGVPRRASRRAFWNGNAGSSRIPLALGLPSAAQDESHRPADSGTGLSRQKAVSEKRLIDAGVRAGRANRCEPSSISSTLLERLRARRPEAWQRLVDLYGPVVYGWCRQLGVSQADAADVVQDVFTAVTADVERFRRDRPGDSFGVWLRTITRHRVCDHSVLTARRQAGGRADVGYGIRCSRSRQAPAGLSPDR